MEYKKGHKIKPKEIFSNGVVVFTNGTDDVSPNQISCEAYGYRWNRKNNTCYGFRSNTKIQKLFQNTTNISKGQNKNLLVNGESHQVESGFNNASIIGGTYGKIQRQAEVVIGGGEMLGRNQTSIVQLAGDTTNASATDLTIQGDGTSYIAVQNNSVLGFEVKIIGVCSGGSSGTVGDYKYLEIKGAVKVDNGYNLTFSQSTTSIASVGTTGTAEMSAVADPYITVEVEGTANVNVEWFASVQLTEKKLKSVTF